VRAAHLHALMDLAATPVPRPPDVVKQATDPLLARARHLRFWVSFWMLMPGLSVGIWAMFDKRSPADPTAMQEFLILFFWAGLVPASAVFYYFTAQLKRAPKFVRNGVAFAGRIVRFLDGGGAKYFTFAWVADEGHERRARLKATDVKTPMSEGDAVTVLASSDVKNQVGVILGENGLYVADSE
jgi:hypothetical protein